MKTNLLHRLRTNARAGEKRFEPKSELTILLLLFVALALAGCEGMESGSPAAYSPWPAAPTGRSTSPASQTGFASGLSGRWYHDGRPTSIDVAPDGRNLTVIDEVGRRTTGYATSPGEFEIPQDRLKGRLSHDGRRISWTNGGEWTREAQQRGSDVGQGLSGRWYHDGRPTSIDVAPDGRNLTVIDEVGRRTTGYVTSPGEFTIPQDRLQGRLSHDGRRISWTNGGEWTR